MGSETIEGEWTEASDSHDFHDVCCPECGHMVGDVEDLGLTRNDLSVMHECEECETEFEIQINIQIQYRTIYEGN